MIREVRKTVNDSRAKLARELGTNATYVRKDTVAEVLNAYIDNLENHLKKGESVAIPPLGRIDITIRPKEYFDFSKNENVKSTMVNLKFRSTRLRKYFKGERALEQKNSEEESENESEEEFDDPEQTTEA